MSDPLTELTFWSMVVESLRQTIVCSPENESRVKGYIDARGLAGIITVVVSPIVRDDQLLVMDTEGLQAYLNQSTVRASRELFRFDSFWPQTP